MQRRNLDQQTLDNLGALDPDAVERVRELGADVVGLDSFMDYYPRPLKERNLAAARRHPVRAALVIPALLLLYVLALGSPTYPLPEESYAAWASTLPEDSETARARSARSRFATRRTFSGKPTFSATVICGHTA